MENRKIHGYIYLITNLINGKQYTGQTVETIKIRFDNHCASKNPVISKAIKKYGKENFKIEEIDIAYNQEELNLLEGVYMSWFNTLAPNGYNIKEIIDGKGKHLEETKEKIKASHNTIKNLKIASENGKNSRGKPKNKSNSKYCGVTFITNKYSCCIGFNYKTIHIGHYNDELDAAKAYDLAAIKYFGNDANLNFPELRQDYINGKIIIKKNTKQTNSKSKEANIVICTRKNTFIFKWFDKILNKNRCKSFKDLESAIKFKNEIIQTKNFDKYKRKISK